MVYVEVNARYYLIILQITGAVQFRYKAEIRVGKRTVNCILLLPYV